MEQLFQFIEAHSTQLGNVMIDWTNAIFIFVIVFLFFFTKGYANCRANKKIAKEKNVWSQLIEYHIERTAFCTVVAVVSAYVFVAVTGNAINIMLNYVIIPFASIIFALYTNGIFKLKGWTSSKYPEGLKEEKSGDKKNAQPVSIVINNSVNDDNDDPDAYDNTHFHELGKITQEKFEEKGGSVWFVNFLHQNQCNLNNRLVRNEKEMEHQSKVLEALRLDRVGEKALELESLIYKCLDKGFVTPQEDKMIRKKYHLYHEVLNGNGEIQELYEARYLTLKVHEERRKQNIPVDVERRKPFSN